MPRWVKPEPVEVPDELGDGLGSKLLAELLFRRGFTSLDAATAFLQGGIDVDAPGLPELEQGVDQVLAAVRAGHRICVYGDYDTDGVTSTALLVDLLRGLGAQVTYYVPNRFRDGYGMNTRAIEGLAQEGVTLILTCDCGIKNVTEVAFARQLGMRVVITDHHELGPELPVAEAVINPKRLPEGHACRMIPGVGVAYLFARQVCRALGRDPAEADRWLDLVAVGVIADVVPLQAANRELARRGLQRIRLEPCVGLRALLTVAALPDAPSEEEIAFQIVPRLNSAGRLADASLGVKLLLATSPTEADDLARQLDQLNQERKQITASVVEAASDGVVPGAGAVVLYHPDWHEGVLGIAAGKLAEQLGLPALLMARKHGTNMLVGSARAPGGYALHEMLEACGQHLVKHGGHAAAAGFSLQEERFSVFRAAMLEEVRRRSGPDLTVPPRAAELMLPLATVDRQLYDDVRRAAPFGAENPAPVFYSSRVDLLSARPIGAKEQHLRVVLRDGDQSFTGIWWGAGETGWEPQSVDLFYRIGVNRWKGDEMLQLVIDHMEAAPVEAVTAPTAGPILLRPVLLDRRGAADAALMAEFPDALWFWEGTDRAASRAVDRYGVRPAQALILRSPPPSPALFDELVARTGANRVILAWTPVAPPQEEAFLQTFLRTVAGLLAAGPYIDLPTVTVQTAELEIVARLGLQVLHEGGMLAVEEEERERFRLQPLPGRGVNDGPTLSRLRTIVGESRAFRRFLRTASVDAITKGLQ